MQCGCLVNFVLFISRNILVHLSWRFKCIIVHALSVVHPSLTFYIFDISETTEYNSKKLNRKQVLTVLYQVIVFGSIRKRRWPVQCLVGWDIFVVRPSSLTFHIFNFFSETAERNSTKLNRKQDLDVLYQVCVFRADRKKQDSRPCLWLPETFSTSSLTPLIGIQRNLTGSKISLSSTKFVFFGPIRKKKIAALADDWLRHLRLLLWNRWSEFKETW